MPRGQRRALAPSTSATTSGHGRRAPRPLLLAACSALAAASWCWSGRLCWSTQAAGGRRGALAAAAAAALAVGATDADAFPNAARAFKRDVNDPKRPGPQPGDLGLEARFGQGDEPKLKECDNPPNCFTTTVREIDEGLHDLKPWKFSGKSPKDAIQDVVEAINAYEPGQQGIDGGGFQIKASADNFVYVQFESLRRGHIDDVEFYIEPGTSPDAKEGNMLVRSASRTGFYDFGVNAMRLNTLSDTLVKKGGWEASKITEKSHPRYWGFNCDGGDGRKAPFSVRNKWPDMCVNPPPPNI